MEATLRFCFYFVTLWIFSACVMGMPAIGQQDGVVDLGQPQRTPSQSRSWSGYLRGPRRTSVPSRFDTQLVDLNRNPSYFNYNMLPERGAMDLGSPVWDSRPRQRRSPLDLRGRFSDVDAGFPADDVLRPPRFRDERPRQPERSPYSDHARTGCIDGGPLCAPKPPRKYFDFYS